MVINYPQKKKNHLMKMICIFLILLGFATSVNASLTDGLWRYFSFDGSGCNETQAADGIYIDVNRSGTLPVQVTDANCIKGGCCEFVESATRSIQLTSNFKWYKDSHTICLWAKLGSDVDNDNVFVSEQNGYSEYSFDIGSAEDSIRVYDGTQANRWNAREVTDLEFYCYKVNASDVYFYWNGSKQTRASGTGSNFATDRIGLSIGVWDDYGQFFEGHLDEIGLWERSLTDSEIIELYNLNLAGGDPFSDTLTITFDSRDPSDIDSANVFGKKLNISYNITSLTNASTVKLYYKVVGNHSNNSFFVGGDRSIGEGEWFIDRSYTNDSSENFIWKLSDNDVYPATYNYNETYVETTSKNWFSLDNSTSALFVSLLNISPNKRFNQFEVYAKPISTNANSLRIFFCNNTYLFDMSVAASSSCAQFNSIEADDVYNHSHGPNSNHYLIGMPIIDGKVSGIGVSNNNYLVFLGRNTLYWNVSYVTDYSRQSITYSNNLGINPLNYSRTIDTHIHQYNGSELFCFFVEADDTNSSIICDSLQFSPLPPTSPIIDLPETDYFGQELIFVNWSPSISPQGDAISYYNISAYNNSGLAQTFPSVNGLNTSLNVSLLAEGNYSFRVIGVDNNSRSSSFGESNIFGIDRTFPTVIFTSPSNNSVITNGTITFDWTAIDDNSLWSISVDCSGANSYSYSISNLSGKTYNFNEKANFTVLGENTCRVEVKDSHTKEEISNWDNKVSVGNYSEKSLLLNNQLEVKLYSYSSIRDIWITDKNIDRYGWCVQVLNDVPYIKFKIDPNCIKAYSSYKGHFVCYDNYWMDLETPQDFPVKMNNDNSIATIDLQYNIESKDEVICFNSAGELNSINYTVYFNTSAAPIPPSSSIDLDVCPTTTYGMLFLFGVTGILILIYLIGYLLFSPLAYVANIGFILLGISFVFCSYLIGSLILIAAVLMLAFTAVNHFYTSKHSTL